MPFRLYGIVKKRKNKMVDANKILHLQRYVNGNAVSISNVLYLKFENVTVKLIIILKSSI